MAQNLFNKLIGKPERILNKDKVRVHKFGTVDSCGPIYYYDINGLKFSWTGSFDSLSYKKCNLETILSYLGFT